MQLRDLIVTALLAVFLVLLGSLKIPGLIPGSEFQLSAPIAVVMIFLFGFKRYFLAGLVASGIDLLLGTATIFNVLVALVFRLTLGTFVALGGRNVITIIFGGPVGSICARLALAGALNVPAEPLLLAALPGMLSTALVVLPLYITIYRLLRRTSWKKYIHSFSVPLRMKGRLIHGRSVQR